MSERSQEKRQSDLLRNKRLANRVIRATLSLLVAGGVVIGALAERASAGGEYRLYIPYISQSGTISAPESTPTLLPLPNLTPTVVENTPIPNPNPIPTYISTPIINPSPEPCRLSYPTPTLSGSLTPPSRGW